MEVLAAQPVVDAHGSDLEVARDPVNPGQDPMASHLTDDMGIVSEPAAPGYPDQPSVLVVAPEARLAARKAWRLADEYLAQADAIRAEAAIGHLDGAGDQNFV